MLSPSDCRSILLSHDGYWESQRSFMLDYHRAYMTRFWDKQKLDPILRTEVAKTFQVIESYIGSLYSRNPQVEVFPDLRADGDPAVARAVSNRALGTFREVIEDSTRLALIFPFSAVKLAPVLSSDPLRRVAAAALPPWEVVVDHTATSWEQQRWVGHAHLVPAAEVKARYGRKSGITPRAYSRWLDHGVYAREYRGVSLDTTEETGYADQAWVRVVEIYDLVADRMLVWSPDYKGGDKFLFRGVKVQVGGAETDPSVDASDAEVTEVVESSIPFRSASDRPVVPIIPIFFSRDPAEPMRGYSLVARIYDQIRETNLMRTYNAQGVRRMARQWLMRAGMLDAEASAKISQGMDGEIIEVSLSQGQDLEGSIIPVPTAPIPPDIALYQAQVEQDIQQAGVNAPFTSGEVTGVTATENRLLQQYTANQLGRMARTRDAAIAQIARVYNTMLAVILDDDGEPLNLPGVGPTILTAEDLKGDFDYVATDSGSTPSSDAARRDSLTANIEALLTLGANREALLKELVRVYDLPESFLKASEPAQQPAPVEPPDENAV
jgi:hypothetical protein